MNIYIMLNTIFCGISIFTMKKLIS